jgi:hypothetical protein
MLTAEIKVNGILLAHVYIHNEGYLPKNLSNDPNFCNYKYEIYEIGNDTGKSIFKGSVIHDRDLGWLSLLGTIQKDIGPKMKGKYKRTYI